MNPDDKLGLLRKAGIIFLPPHIPRFMRRPSNRVKPMITLSVSGQKYMPHFTILISGTCNRCASRQGKRNYEKKGVDFYLSLYV